jgi:hypothetical protein
MALIYLSLNERSDSNKAKDRMAQALLRILRKIIASGSSTRDAALQVRCAVCEVMLCPASCARPGGGSRWAQDLGGESMSTPVLSTVLRLVNVLQYTK